MFDAHCHLNFEVFDSDRDDVLAAARSAGVNGLIIAGYDRERRTLARSLVGEMTDERPEIRATAGLHPWALQGKDDAWLDTELKALREDLEAGGFCGIGELGLDFIRAHSPEDRSFQERALVGQLGIARELNLPIVIHAVKCHNSLYEILRREGLPKAGGMMHGYSGSARQVGNFLMLNLDISIGTQATYPNRRKLMEVIRAVPLDRLLLETDSPDQPAYGHENQRNTPAQLALVVNAVAAARECSVQEIARQTENNVKMRFAQPFAFSERNNDDAV